MRNVLLSLLLLLSLLFLSVTSSADDSSLRFLMLGDWGISGYNQQSVAKAMGIYASNYTQDFVLLLGDNFYKSGVQSSSDSLWSSMFENVYLNYSSLQVPYYPVLGNHDWGYGWSGGLAQVQYSSLSPYWKMPSLNYSMNFDIPGGGTVSMVFIETCRLAVIENKWCNYKGGTVSYNQQIALIQHQLARIDTMLSDAVSKRPTWLLVVGHYEVFSAGDHGDMSEMKQYLLPLLQKYNVDAYICGHDHISEILTYGDQVYVVAGAGAMVDYLKATTSANLIWYGVGYSSFASAVVTTSALTFSFIDTSGDTKVTYSLTPKPCTQSQPTSTPTAQPPTTSHLPSLPSSLPTSHPTRQTAPPVPTQQPTAVATTSPTSQQPTSVPTSSLVLSSTGTGTSYDQAFVALSVVAGVAAGSILIAAAFYTNRGSWSYHRNGRGASSNSTVVTAAATAPVSIAILERPSRKSATAWVKPPPLPPLGTSSASSYARVPFPFYDNDIPASQRDRSATEAAHLIEQGQGQGQGQNAASATTPKNDRRSKTTLF